MVDDRRRVAHGRVAVVLARTALRVLHKLEGALESVGCADRMQQQRDGVATADRVPGFLQIFRKARGIQVLDKLAIWDEQISQGK